MHQGTQKSIYFWIYHLQTLTLGQNEKNAFEFITFLETLIKTFISRMHENMEIKFPVNELDNLQHYFVDMVKRRMEASGDETLKIHKDAAFTENPMEREDVEETIKVCLI